MFSLEVCENPRSGRVGSGQIPGNFGVPENVRDSRKSRDSRDSRVRILGRVESGFSGESGLSKVSGFPKIPRTRLMNTSHIQRIVRKSVDFAIDFPKYKHQSFLVMQIPTLSGISKPSGTRPDPEKILVPTRPDIFGFSHTSSSHACCRI